LSACGKSEDTVASGTVEGTSEEATESSTESSSEASVESSEASSSASESSAESTEASEASSESASAETASKESSVPAESSQAVASTEAPAPSQAPVPEPPASNYTPAVIDPSQMYRSELTNEWISQAIQNQRPVAIMVDNEKTALDHYGVTQADIVYEMMNSTANDEVTRLMCIVKDWGSITRFGSIRTSS